MMLQLDDDGVFSKVNEEDLIYVDKKELDEFIEEYNHLKKENEQLKQYKQAVSDVLINWSQKNLSAKQLQVVIAIMEELNVIGDWE